MGNLKRDLWNVMMRHVPSRTVRGAWLKWAMPGRHPSAFVAMGVTLLEPNNIMIGQRAVVNTGVILDGRGAPVIVENDVDIAPHVHIWTLEHDPHDQDHATRAGAVTIRHHCWIASRSTILPGVELGFGAVVAAGAVVAHDVPPCTIVAGVPARPIGKRKNPLAYTLKYNPRFR
jgi:acetyltransferase-like isoleucine patch superfamily enzyme